MLVHQLQLKIQLTKPSVAVKSTLFDMFTAYETFVSNAIQNQMRFDSLWHSHLLYLAPTESQNMDIKKQTQNKITKVCRDASTMNCKSNIQKYR